MTVRVRTNGTGQTGQDMGGYAEDSAGLRKGAEGCVRRGRARKVARVARDSIGLRLHEDSDEVDVYIRGYEPVGILLPTAPTEQRQQNNGNNICVHRVPAPDSPSSNAERRLEGDPSIYYIPAILSAAVLPTFVALHEWYNLHDILGEHAAFLTHHHLHFFFFKWSLGSYVHNKLLQELDFDGSPSMILDFGCGCGLWAIEAARQWQVAYSGSHHEDVLTLLLPAVVDDVILMRKREITSAILETLMERDDKELDKKWGRFMWLGLALLYIVWSFITTGNVLRVQILLYFCGEHLDALKEREEAESAERKKYETKDEKKVEKKVEKKPDDTFQLLTILGIAIIAMGEDLGVETSMQFNHLMHYGDPIIRKSVPLDLGLISASNSHLPVLDMLSKCSHNHDLAVALNAIFAMGLVGAGTNNARLAQMLNQLVECKHH
ncbi:hypothetical protein DEU56DRAFT_923788 [Suillus clintonianus]|uniref:uncharacterized protein n=1 Tax=Suillus clintonianus TaxID=1904413 RepID=UPI001B860DDF|nr:uncharacterized protein DEU56DRAFT_923788 [Suillus clintonianus]KAG2123859.1 hypothetical protein DEU56DRAFT_923788 [Suillus clintonianus]